MLLLFWLIGVQIGEYGLSRIQKDGAKQIKILEKMTQ